MPKLGALLKNKYLAFLFRLILGGIFVYASLDKIANPGAYTNIIYYYHFLPGEAINLFAIILPWVELLAGMALILGVFTEAAAFIVGFLLLMFVVALGSAVIRHLDINCGCFSTKPSSSKAAWETIVRDLIFLVLVIQVYYCNGGFASLGRRLERKRSS